MHSHLFLTIVRHELVEALLDLDHSHVIIGVSKDVPEVLGVVATVPADSNYRILQLSTLNRIGHKEEVAEDFCLDMLYSCIEWLDFIVREVLH